MDEKQAFLFGSVPPDLFRVFAGPSRFFFADLLAHLAEDLFGHAGEIATRRRVQAAIEEYIDRSGRAAAIDALAADAAEAKQAADDGAVPSDAGTVEEHMAPSAPPTKSHIAAYDRLKATGWLVEYRDRYRRVVDFDPSARLVLHTLLDIRSGRVRSYGGAVLNVLTLLQSVEADLVAKALNLREAALAARGFMSHLRTVAGTMRRVEALIMAQPSAAGVIRQFVARFIEAEVVQDYRNLQSRESPYRFRGLIIETGERLLENEGAIAAIANGWKLGGIARDEGEAREAIIQDLRDTVRVFAAIDDHVHDIETTTYRIERRMTNVVRFSDRIATVSTDRLLYALELLSQSDIAPSSPVEARVRLQLETLPLAPPHLYSPPRKRRPPAERVVEIKPPDIALQRYLEAVDYFSARVGVTPAKLSAYIERGLGEKEEAGPEAFPVAHIDDFILFERLHEVGLAPLDRLYEFVEREGDSANDWIERRDFVVRRKETADG